MNDTCIENHKKNLVIYYGLDVNRKLTTCGHVRCTDPVCKKKYDSVINSHYNCRICSSKSSTSLFKRSMICVDSCNIQTMCSLCKKETHCLFVLVNNLIVDRLTMNRYKENNVVNKDSILVLVPPTMHKSMILEDIDEEDDDTPLSDAAVCDDEDPDDMDSNTSFYSTIQVMICTHTICNDCLNVAQAKFQKNISIKSSKFKMCPVDSCNGFGVCYQKIAPTPKCTDCKQTIEQNEFIGNKCTSSCTTMFCENCYKTGICKKLHSYERGICNDVRCPKPKTRKNTVSVRVLKCSQCECTYCDNHAYDNGINVLSNHHIVYYCNTCVNGKKRLGCVYRKVEDDSITYYRVEKTVKYKRKKLNTGEIDTSEESSGDDEDEEGDKKKMDKRKKVGSATTGPIDMYVERLDSKDNGTRDKCAYDSSSGDDKEWETENNESTSDGEDEDVLSDESEGDSSDYSNGGDDDDDDDENNEDESDDGYVED